MTMDEYARRETAAGWSPPDQHVPPEPQRFAIPAGPDTLVLPVGVATRIPGTDVLLYHEEPEPIRIRYRVGGEGPWPNEPL